MILSANLRAYRCKKQFEVIIARVIVLCSLQYYNILALNLYEDHLLLDIHASLTIQHAGYRLH